MTIDLDAIEAAARGVRRVNLDDAWFDAETLPRTTFLQAEAHHIATMDPQTTLALVERVRELEAIVREGARKAGSYDEWCMSWSWMEGQAARMEVDA